MNEQTDNTDVWTSARHAQLALLLEACGSPTPGNVDRHHDLPSLRLEHFLAGAIGASTGLEMAATGAPIGEAFERAISGMGSQSGGNTQFGALLLLIPLVSAARTDLDRETLESILSDTSVADTAAFYRAFDHVDVAVEEPPDGLEDLDVRRGGDAVPAVESAGISLIELMEESAPIDDIAREWSTGFERSFGASNRLARYPGTTLERVGRLQLSVLAERPDTHVRKRHGIEVARWVRRTAQSLHERDAITTDPEAVETFADELIDGGINPGTSADITAAGTFIALERGVLRV